MPDALREIFLKKLGHLCARSSWSAEIAMLVRRTTTEDRIAQILRSSWSSMSLRDWSGEEFAEKGRATDLHAAADLC